MHCKQCLLFQIKYCLLIPKLYKVLKVKIMAIGFVKSRYVSRSNNGNACNSSAYNARSKIIDKKTGQVFNWTKRDNNLYHEVLLPEHVDKKFKNISVLKKCHNSEIIMFLNRFVFYHKK